MGTETEVLERFFAAINRNDMQAWVRLKESNEWVGGRFADGFVFRGGKIVEYLSFAERAAALRWAAIEE